MTARIVVVGPPNAGKSTLFNGLTGSLARTGNYAGTTVGLQSAPCTLPSGEAAELVDVPGCYSLAARSPEERLALQALLGLGGLPRPDLVLLVLDAPRLDRSLYLALQVLELGLPVVVALNLVDEAEREGRAVQPEALGERLGVVVVPTVARRREGLEALGQALATALVRRAPAPSRLAWPPDLGEVADRVAAALPVSWREGRTADASRALGVWALLSLEEGEDFGGSPALVAQVQAELAAAKAAGRDLIQDLVAARYLWIDAELPGLRRAGPTPVEASWSARIDRILLHPIAGLLLFGAVMSGLFGSLFWLADPVVGLIEDGFTGLGGRLGYLFGWAQQAAPGLAGPIELLGAFVVDGLIAGVGAVVVFLPQIALLFLLLALLEDAGYLSRAAHLMDRVLRLAGLPGQAFVPLLSGYACAVPAILATRTLPRFRDRLLTMMVLPLTSCSARLPVYVLLVGALFPPELVLAGLTLPARPLALMAMYLFSTVLALLAAAVLGQLILPDRAAPALLELPPYRLPDPKTVARLVAQRCGDFLREAGGVILVATVVLWALLSFPRQDPALLLTPAEQETLSEADQEGLRAERALEASAAGHLGKALEPIIAPLGFDWKIGIGLVGAFAAREVFVSTLGVTFALGADVDEEDAGLREKLASAKRSDGTRAYTPLVGASLMTFFAVAMQCLSTLGVLVKETRGWRWPAFITGYLFVLAWGLSFMVYQGGRWLGFE